MTEVYIRLNSKTERYDCYNVLTDRFEQTLTCGNSFMLIPHDEDIEVPGRIEYDRSKGYYWIDSNDLIRQKLENDMKGYI